MKTRRRLSVRAATILVFAAVLAAAAVIAVATTLGVRENNRARERADRAITNSALYDDAIASAYNEWVTVVALFTLRDQKYIDEFHKSRQTVENSLTALLSDAARNEPELVPELQDYIATHARFAEGDEQVIAAISAGDLVEALRLATEFDLTVDSQRVLTGLQKKVDDQRDELREAQEQQHRAEVNTLRWWLLIGAMCALLLMAIGYAGHTWIGGPMRRASEATRAIAAGDLSSRVPLGGPAELAGLADDVNTMAEALIKRSEELNAYLSKDLEARTADLERANAELAREVEERRRAEEALGRTLEAEKELEEQLRHQAFHDPLTKLANRARFMDRLEHALQRAARRKQPVAVIFMDLDDFKSVNDSLGHPAGDKLLVEVAARLQANLRPGDTAARFGGDEFAVLLEETPNVDTAAVLAQRIIDALRVPLTLNGTEVFVRASMGISAGTRGDRPDELLRQADVALYVAKAEGKGRLAIYNMTMEESLVGRLELAGELQRAIEREEFVLHYQPSIILDSGKIAGVEALLRWHHPTRGLLQPADFVPVAESTGLILPLGGWVLRTACAAARAWQLRYPQNPPLTMAVNISARQVHQPGLLDVVSEALADSGLPPQTLILEITESLMMQDANLAIARLNELKQLGVRLAIDDFGTGYSSLSYLRRFPVDILKIDKSFVDGVSHAGKERELAESIIELGHSLDLEIVAEGVEQPEQLGWLQTHHCSYAQGFYFSRPVAEEDILRLLDSGRLDMGTQEHVA